MHAASSDVQAQVAAVYSGLFVPVFAGLAVVYAAGIVAATLLPSGRLSNEPAARTEPVTA